MIDLYFWPTPNGLKISVFLEEAGLPYRVVPVNIGRGEQFAPEFLAISPNNRIPAIVDTEPAGGGEPVGVFESGAILTYLAEKTGRFLPTEVRARKAVFEWLAWQVGGVGPMLGQLGHFTRYASENIPYAIDRYRKEANRLFGVLERQLTTTNADYVAGEYSIADMALFPWMRLHETYGLDLSEVPKVRAWLDRVGARPAVVRGLAVGHDLNDPKKPLDEQARKVLFGQR